jgi:hypothetical protein
VDNDSGKVNICIFDKKSGALSFKHPLFSPGRSACENSIVAYGNNFIVSNTYGYTDPFVINETEGGIHKFIYYKDGFELDDSWGPIDRPYDGKTATPKLSTANGLLYVYNRFDDGPTEHMDWRFTALDYRSGKEVFFLKPYFEEEVFNDNISGIMKAGSLGKKNYDRKVFNNLWGTFTIGPNNAIYLGTYRGFIRVWSE